MCLRLSEKYLPGGRVYVSCECPSKQLHGNTIVDSEEIRRHLGNREVRKLFNDIVGDRREDRYEHLRRKSRKLLGNVRRKEIERRNARKILKKLRKYNTQ